MPIVSKRAIHTSAMSYKKFFLENILLLTPPIVKIENSSKKFSASKKEVFLKVLVQETGRVGPGEVPELSTT